MHIILLKSLFHSWTNLLPYLVNITCGHLGSDEVDDNDNDGDDDGDDDDDDDDDSCDNCHDNDGDEKIFSPIQSTSLADTWGPMKLMSNGESFMQFDVRLESYNIIDKKVSERWE